MSITNYAVVNQKLSCARALLKLINDLPTPLPTNQRIPHTALLQGSVFHLIYAYQFYIREIAERRQIARYLHIESENQLVAAFESAGVIPSEALELNSLRQDPHSWVAKMHEAYAAIGLLPTQKDKSPAETSRDHLIAIVALDPESGDTEMLTQRQVSEWEKAFSDLIFRQREVGAEY